ncbi:NUDIX domain-containing protein [Sphingomonas hylomeconis]|uniref:NUDIX domain-containing protein n=1 Tax=Sphingomonas hylomeconis TaxID=1395958 RepID=A0ABV7SXE0_9SPHN|nr:NUDIX domain-containing protein [Sphingomonas hylomeconis]
MARRSAGILLYRTPQQSLELLLVHPGGPFWRHRHTGAWQLPKGMVEPGEADEAAARREVAEELGVRIETPLLSLGEVRQSGGKIVVAFAAERDVDPALVVSNTIEIDWPPRSGQKMTIPEVDEARWFAVAEARQCILPSQAPLIDRLVAALAATG